MSIQAYSEYAHTGVDWIGEIPSHWGINPLFGSVIERKEKNKGMIEDNLLSLSYGRIIRKDIETMDGLLPESFETYQIVRSGDIVFRLTDLQNDKRSLRSAIVEEDGIITSAYLAVTPVRQHSRYMNYLFRAYDVSKVFYSMGGGLRQSMKFSDLKRMPTVIPPYDEQETISSFLDVETSKIDGLVSEQRRLIELLKEKRQAVISRAVTGGLNSNAKMKPSGIEWLGDVPQHWDVIALKHLVSKPIIDGPHVSPQKYNEGVPFISAESIGKGFIDFDKKWGYISPEDHALYSQRYSPERGDILLVKLGATTGIPAIVETDMDFSIWVPLAAIRLKPKVEPRFVFHVLRSDNLKVAYELNWTYGTQQTLGLGTISNLRIPVPPHEEQKEITDYLDSIIPAFESLTAEAERAIELLHERRAALISAAVTGKIDVRDHVLRKTA